MTGPQVASLPIDAILPELIAKLRAHPSLVLRAPPGAGKTTRVPPAILGAGLAQGQVLVLEPRRIAARLSARRVAAERGEQPGASVGYQVRFEDVTGPDTRICFVTEGVLTRRLATNPSLPGVSVVVLDEFHERHLHTDLALALLRSLQRGSRPELRIVVMSATLDCEPIARFLGDCPVLQAEGRVFEVAVEHEPAPDDRALELRVVSAARKLVREGLDGDVLVFLPGASEIRKAREALASLSSQAGLEIVALHGELPLSEQDRALRPSDRRKLVLSTNVAETSITVEGVAAVIDSGLARVASHASWSGLDVLVVTRVSKASAEQRAGRAGRTRPGRCLRLYTKHDFATRPDHETPEIRRTDLAEVLLVLASLDTADPSSFGWFEPPPETSWRAARALLSGLGALDQGGAITQEGRALLRFPLHPRLAKLVTEGVRRGVVQDACAVAAIAGERDLLIGRRAAADLPSSSSDLLASLELLEEARAARFDPDRLRYAGIDAHAARSVERVRRQLLAIAGARDAMMQGRDRENALLQSVLAAHPDRVARRVRGSELALAAGGTASLSPGSVVRQAPLLVAVDAEQRKEGRGSGVSVRVASAIEPDWLLELFPQSIASTSQLEWNEPKQRVELIERLQYGELTLHEERDTHPSGPEVAAALHKAAAAAGVSSFAARDALDRWTARVRFVAARVPSAGLSAMTAQDLDAALREACEGCSSFEELRGKGILHALRHRLSPAQREAIDKLAPEQVTLPAGRTVKIHYEAASEPWIASRLQDFFGMQQGPAIAGGSVPLVLHLLAPNQRAVQVTRDLSGFWERHYPAVRRELCRKYPKHAWPEDGRTASPPGRRR